MQFLSIRGLSGGRGSRDPGLRGERAAPEAGPPRARSDIGKGQFGTNSRRDIRRLLYREVNLTSCRF